MNCCPYCGREYADGVAVCPIDQAPLKAGVEAAPRFGVVRRIRNWVVIISSRRELLRHPEVLFLMLGLAAIVSIAVYLHFFYDYAFLEFEHRDDAYFAQVAKDCDSILRQDPMGSPKLKAYPTERGGWFSVPATNLRLPATIRALHPSGIIVSTNGIVLKFGGGWYLQWILIWQKVELNGDTPAWVLTSERKDNFCERPLYTEKIAVK